jgi:hypothetical protein
MSGAEQFSKNVRVTSYIVAIVAVKGDYNKL